jgi:hypothetical protein
MGPSGPPLPHEEEIYATNHLVIPYSGATNTKESSMFHRPPRFNKCLENLRKSGGKAARAATRAEEIIQWLQDEPDAANRLWNHLTKHGELRIDRCVKYDLGGAYRLVGVRRGRNLVFSFVGTHDDCDRWLENNRGHAPQIEPDVAPPLPEAKTDESPGETLEPQADYDALLMERIDEQVLRKVFSGICRS